jgi:hypothetical protein
MRFILFFCCLAPWAVAHDYRVLVDGAGCRTRQLAIQPAFAAMPGVKQVDIRPLAEAPALNQRYFIIRSSEKISGTEPWIDALGRRAKFYHVQKVEALEPKQEMPAGRAEGERAARAR